MANRIVHGPEFKYPLDDCTLGEFLFNKAEEYKNNICQIDGTLHQSETYGSVRLRSTRLAIAMQKMGVTSGDVIAVCSGNTLDNTIPLIASFYLGAVVCNTEGSLSLKHTKHLLGLSTPRLIFVEESAVNLIEESLVGAGFQTEIVVLGRSTKHSTFGDLVRPQEGEEEFRPVKVDVNDLTLLLFSSGTTGLPKAISHTHRSFLHFIRQTHQMGLTESVYHSSMFYWMTAHVALGACFKTGSFRIFTRNASAEDIIKIVEKYKINSLFISPVVSYKLTAVEKGNRDTSSLKLILCAGAPMPAAQIQKMNDYFSSAITLLPCGMSEIGVVACFDPEDDEELVRKKIGSCGKPAPGVTLKIVDPLTGELLGPNEKGEIHLKAASIMKGYYNGDASQVFDEDGFLKTGDIGYYDEDECVYVIERLKEVLKYQGWHVIPSTVEGVLLEHPAIKEACVFGYPDDKSGDLPAACVVLREGFSLSEEEIDAFLKQRVADPDRLRGGVTFVDGLPRTLTGKVVRREVRDCVLKSGNRSTCAFSRN